MCGDWALEAPPSSGGAPIGRRMEHPRGRERSARGVLHPEDHSRVVQLVASRSTRHLCRHATPASSVSECVRGRVSSRHHYSEGEFSRSGDEVRGGRRRSVATAASATGAAAVAAAAAATVGTGLPASPVPGCLPLCISWVSDTSTTNIL